MHLLVFNICKRRYGQIVLIKPVEQVNRNRPVVATKPKPNKGDPPHQNIHPVLVPLIYISEIEVWETLGVQLRGCLPPHDNTD